MGPHAQRSPRRRLRQNREEWREGHHRVCRAPLDSSHALVVVVDCVLDFLDGLLHLAHVLGNCLDSLPEGAKLSEDLKSHLVTHGLQLVDWEGWRRRRKNISSDA